MLETILQSFNFIPHTASEDYMFVFFLHTFCILVAMCNQSNQEVIFPIISQWLIRFATKKKKKKKTHTKRTKKNTQYYSFPLPIDAICEIW